MLSVWVCKLSVTTLAYTACVLTESHLADCDDQVTTNEEGGISGSSKAHEVGPLHGLGGGMGAGGQVPRVRQHVGRGWRPWRWLQYIT